LKKLGADYALFFGGLFAGGLLVSQGVSFLTWTPSGDLAKLIEKHAYALAVAGVGIFCVSLLLVRLLARLGRLEGQLERERAARVSHGLEANA
jgi:hypothetical protein